MAVRFNPKRLFRFNIGTMLFATLCVSVYLSSHRAGERNGAKDRYDESFVTKVYNFSDVAISRPDPSRRDELYGEIIDHLRTTVATESWTLTGDYGEMCDIQPFPAMASLIITQRGAMHDQIDAALGEYRDRQTKAQTEKGMREIERLAADERIEPVVLTNYSADEPLAASAVELRFQNTVRNLAERWGDPRFSGKCTDAGFPDWSVAQSIATWPKNGGEAYLAVQDWPEVGRVLLTGWHPRE